MSRRTLKYSFLALALSVAMAAQGADELLTKARRLVDQKKPKEAYELLVVEQSNRAGEVEFDYLLGISALDSGKPAEAVFALERVLAMQPDNLPARAEIGRAYAALGEYPTARKELQTVKSQPVPGEVADVIQRYIDQLDKVVPGDRRRVQAYVQAGAGYDTNVNQGPSGVPLLGGAATNVAGLEVGDWVGALAGGVSFSQPLQQGFAVFGLAEARTHFSLTSDFSCDVVTPGQTVAAPGCPLAGGTKDVYNNTSLDGNLGVSYTMNAEQFSLAATGSFYDVDNEDYRNTWGVVGQWAHNFDQRSRLTTYAQWAALDYPDDYPGNQGRDAHRWAFGGTYQQALISPMQPVFYAGAYAGRELIDSAVPVGGGQFLQRPSNDFYGLRGGGQLRIQESVLLFGNLSYEHRSYSTDLQQAALGLPLKRGDNQVLVDVGAEWTFIKDWKLIPRIEYTNNSSNSVTNEYDRTVATVSVRRDFDW